MYLTDQRKHVGQQSRLQLRIGVDLFLRRVLFGLLEDIGQGWQPGAAAVLDHRKYLFDSVNCFTLVSGQVV